MKYLISLLICAISAIVLVAKSFAETFYLKSGESVTGEIESLSKDKYSVKLLDASRRTIKRSDILRIDFTPVSKKGEKPESFLKTITAPDSVYKTPLNTFRAWREAAIQGDIDKMVKCYASFKQEEKRSELRRFTKADFDKMRSATAETVFTPAQPLYQGDRATLEVNWIKGVQGDSQMLQFVLEKNDWKLIE